MKSVYIITGCEYTPKEVFTDKARAEKEMERVNLDLRMMGSWNRVSVEKLKVNTEKGGK